MAVKSIDLLAPPFRGHLHPILAMARELKDEGYEVCVFSTSSVEAEIQAAGVPVKILSSIDDIELLQVVNPPWRVGHSAKKMNLQFHQVLKFFNALTEEIDEIYASRKTDLIIADFTLAPVGICAERYGLKWWTSMPSPCVLETRDGPPAYLGGWNPATNFVGRVKNFVGRKLVRLFKRSIFYLYRKPIRQLGLESIYRGDGSEAIYSPEKILCPGDAAIEFLRSWPRAVQFVGPKLYSPPIEADSPEFIEGRRHILVTLGTHLNWHKESVWEALVSAAKSHQDCVFHFSHGGHDLELSGSLNNCRSYPYINYAENIQRYDLVVHHGGAGIMYYCLQAGIQAIVYPVDYDQFDHAARLEYYKYAVWLKRLEELERVLTQMLETRAEVLPLANDYPSLTSLVMNQV